MLECLWVRRLELVTELIGLRPGDAAATKALDDRAGERQVGRGIPVPGVAHPNLMRQRLRYFGSFQTVPCTSLWGSSAFFTTSWEMKGRAFCWVPGAL